MQWSEHIADPDLTRRLFSGLAQFDPDSEISTMADVICFKRRSAILQRPARPDAGGRPAEIVIFPGVRYEYHDESAPKPRRQSARRDMLERAD